MHPKKLIPGLLSGFYAMAPKAPAYLKIDSSSHSATVIFMHVRPWFVVDALGSQVSLF
jgi:hypothetical protein